MAINKQTPNPELEERLYKSKITPPKDVGGSTFSNIAGGVGGMVNKGLTAIGEGLDKFTGLGTDKGGTPTGGTMTPDIIETDPITGGQPKDMSTDITATPIDGDQGKTVDDFMNVYDADGNVTGRRSKGAANILFENYKKGTPTDGTTGDTTDGSTIPGVIGKEVDGIFGSDRWTSEEMNLYNTMTPEEKKALKVMTDGTKGTIEDIYQAQIDYLAKSKATKDYMNSQNEKKTQIDEVTGDVIEIQSSARIAQAKTQLDNMKKNIAYLGDQGRPGTSLAKLDAIKDMVSNAEKTYSDLVVMEEKMKTARDLGKEMESAKFERDMELLQNDLDSKVNQIIQDGFNMFTAAEMEGKLDDIPTLNKFIDDLMLKMDNDIAGMADINLQQQQFLVNTAMNRIEEQKQFNINKNDVKINPATNQYYDANGNPVLDATTGAPIMAPEEEAREPLMDIKNGKFYTFAYDETGMMVSTEHTLFDKPTFETSTIANYAKLVSEGKIGLGDVPVEISSTESFINTLAKAKFAEPEADYTYMKSGDDIVVMSNGKVVSTYKGATAEGGMTPYELANLGAKTITDEDGVTYKYNPQTMDYEKLGATVADDYKGKDYTAVDPVEMDQKLSVFSMQNQEGDPGGRCGAFVNDYLEELGLGFRPFGNLLSQKKKYINSQTPTPGSIAIMDSEKYPDNGHVAIVKFINDDGTLTTIESNKAGEKEVFSRKSLDPANVIGYFDPTLDMTKAAVDAQEGKTTEPASTNDLLELSQYLIDIQPRGQGFSEDDVKQFTEAINRYATAGDKETVYQLFRNKILENKDLNDTLYDSREFKVGIDMVRGLLDDYKQSGGDTNVFTSIAEKVANYMGTTTSEELAKVNNQLGMLVADYIRSISGTAASDVEVQRLVNNLPKIKNVEGFNLAVLDQLEDRNNKIPQSRLELYLGFKKDLAPKIFPEFYPNGEEGGQTLSQDEQDVENIFGDAADWN